MREQKEAVERIIKELNLNNGPIRFNPSLEGQCVIDGIIYVGARLNLIQNDPASLLHELSHFVEIDEYRMNHQKWGFKYPEVWVYDRMCMEPKTSQMTDRELRVCAYQAHLHKYFKVNEPITETIKSLRWLADDWLVPFHDGSNSSNTTIEYRNYHRSRYITNMRKVLGFKKEFTLERFFYEFNRRVNILNEIRL